jgi:chromosome condensin MukBEF ATPase and DNA-binding subunit MukB
MVDPDLIAYLDQRFRESAAQTAALREETVQQFTAVRTEAAEFRQETAQQFAAVRAEAAEFRQETAQRFQQVEDTARHTLVLVEGLHGSVDLLAEGYGALNERLERLQKEVALLPGQIKVWIEPYLKNLDGRVRTLEGSAGLRQPGPQA